MFPDTGEQGRVVVTLKRNGPALTGTTFVLTTSDADVTCISEGRVDVGAVDEGQVITIGSLDPAQPGFTFVASDTLETLSPMDPARVELCLRFVADETSGVSDPICFDLLADLDAPAGGAPPLTLGPDGLADTADDGITFESFDVDKDGDGVFGVADTFLQPQDVGDALVYFGPPGHYLRGSDSGDRLNTVATVPCGGFDDPAAGNPACALDPDFPFDWHFHCPPGARDCPNDEILPGGTAPRTCVGGCSHDTPLNGELALSPPNSLHMGAHFSPEDALAGDTTHLRAVQAFVSAPVNLTPTPRPGDLELSFFHIVDLVDTGPLSGTDGTCLDCADVQIQIDLDPDPAVDLWGFWDKLAPYQNVYDSVADDGTFGVTYCLFTPADTGAALPAPRGAHETICFPQGAWSSCGSDSGTGAAATGDCEGPGLVDPSGAGVWVESRFDLGGFLGQRVRIRWIGTSWVFSAGASSYFDVGGGWETTEGDDGWWLDDVRVAGTIRAQTPPVPDTSPPPQARCPKCSDVDGDGYGDPGQASCAGGAETDCDDVNPRVFPGNPEVCDGVDNDCDGTVEQRDRDGDGFQVCLDCDDADPARHPGATEVCNDIDDDCNGLVDDDPAGLDSDDDSVPNACDNCRFAFNPSQADTDTDGNGDSCDNCELDPNPDQADLDSDGRGDICDNCPGVPNPGQEDADRDG
ncbi:MAG: MopE-related protein, partial [Acidobacteriota bacterium]